MLELIETVRKAVLAAPAVGNAILPGIAGNIGKDRIHAIRQLMDRLTPTRMPLHNHPNMTVFSRILYGKMNFKAYDWVPAHYTPGPITPSNHRPKLAKMVANSVVTPSTPTHITHEDRGGNVHSFSAVESSALLDVIIPPYNDTDRQVTYFEECDDESEDEDEDEYSDDDDEVDDDEVDENGKPVQKAWLLAGDPPEDYCCMKASEEDLETYIYQPKS